MNTVYADYLETEDGSPARTTVEVSRLPRNVLIEMEMIAEV